MPFGKKVSEPCPLVLRPSSSRPPTATVGGLGGRYQKELPNGPKEEFLECTPWKGGGGFSLGALLDSWGGGGYFLWDQEKKSIFPEVGLSKWEFCVLDSSFPAFLPTQFCLHPADCRRKPWPSRPGSLNVPTRLGASWPQKSPTSIKMTWKRTMCSC